LKRLAARELFAGGMAAAVERGERVRFATLTGKAMTLEEIGLGWNRVATALRRRGLLDQYAAVVELTAKGNPHLHVLMTGDFIPQAYLTRIAQGRRGSKGRFGRVTHIRDGMKRLEDAGSRLPGYLTKDIARQQVGGEMAAYVSKAKAVERSRLRSGEGGRRRPIRASLLWYPGGLTAAAETVKEGWNSGPALARPDATDWHLWRVDQHTAEILPVKALSAPPVVELAPVVLLPERLARAA
jgi:hypothetical protein